MSGSGVGRLSVRELAAALVLAVLVLGSAAGWAWAERRAADRWAHGGGEVVVRADLSAAATDAEYQAAFARTGVRSAGGHMGDRAQAFVLDVEWDDAPEDGHLGFILLDVRVHPPRPVDGVEVWSDGSARGAHWNGSYEVLAEHYPWLARTASVQVDGGWVNETHALGAPSDRTGSATLAY